MPCLSNRATNVARAIEVLRRLGKEPYDFQAHVAADCIRAIEAKERVLVVAPTGAGKTLISNLIVSLLGQEHTERFPRVLVVVPSRSLLIQHIEDASWLCGEGIPIHRLSADTPFSLYKSIVEDSECARA
jgi:superfamily II DNA or RNA helicase